MGGKIKENEFWTILYWDKIKNVNILSFTTKCGTIIVVFLAVYNHFKSFW